MTINKKQAHVPRRRLLSGTGLAGAGTGMCSGPGWLSFRRIVDIPFEACVAALESWRLQGHDSELHVGQSRLRGPIKHDRGSGTCRVEVRLARGRYARCCACDWTSIAGPPRRQAARSSSFPAGASGPLQGTSGPATSFWTR
jgi:hypothetical protein